MSFYLTSESVAEGHPDKICDQISDAILDEYLSKDPESHVAIECMISKHLLVVAGEVRSRVEVDFDRIVKEVLKKIGYDSEIKGFDYHSFTFIKNIHIQSQDIAQGVDCDLLSRGKSTSEQGAGDQGIMYGYACDETPSLMPFSIFYANQLAYQLAHVRKQGVLPYLYPDGKTQVTVLYDSDGRPIKITDIVISAQHDDMVHEKTLVSDILEKVISPIVPEKFLDKDINIYINPTGRFVLGGPVADTGLTGRKIIVDTYGGVVPHGGGAFSGKDPSKVDRSAAYMARYVAKNIVAAGLAKKCQILLSYAIGLSKPISVTIQTFGTGVFSDDILSKMVLEIFDFSPKGIIATLDLKRPIYVPTATYGHFKDGFDLPWEKLDRVELLMNIGKVLLL